MTETIAGNSYPYFHQYIGVWAIHDPAAEALRDQFENADWNAYLSWQADMKAAANDPRRPTMYGYTITAEGVAVIDVSGTLMKQESSWNDSTSTVMLRRTIRDAVASDKVKAIMLRVDSPGGTVTGTEELAADIADAGRNKPVGVYVDGMMASAAYWIGAQADWIASNETSVIGSIGVLAVIHDQSARAAKQGVKVHVVKSADAKGAGVPGTEITAGQLSEWQRMIDATHAVFVKAVAAGRRITTEAAGQLADARMHVGQQAKQIGMIDFVESFDAAMARLAGESRSVITAAIRAGRNPGSAIALANYQALTNPPRAQTTPAPIAHQPPAIPLDAPAVVEVRKKPGVPEYAAEAAKELDPIAQVDALVDEAIAKNPKLSRPAAMQQIFRSDDELRARWVAARNRR